jgi:diguanylate cyclase (GGDEF)-like protein
MRQIMARGWNVAAAVGIAIFLVAVPVATVGLVSGSQQVARVAPLSMVFFEVSSLVLAWWAAAKRSADRRTRSAWIWIASSFTLLSLAGVLFYAMRGVTSFPRPGDFARMLVMPLLLTGLLRLPTVNAGGGARRLKLALDAGTVGVAGMIFLWYFQVGPALSVPHVTAQRLIASTAYPLGDVLLIFGVAVVVTRGVNAANRRPMWLLAAAIPPWVIGDVYLGYTRSHADGPQVNVVNWSLLCFLTAHFLLAAAAFEQCRWGTHHEDTIGPVLVRRVSQLPYLAVASGFSLLLFAAAREHTSYPWAGLVLCATMLTAVVIARQAIAQRESHRMAVTDGLTGLANRVRLHQALSLVLARGARMGQVTGVLLADLNGFKQVNDTLGHEAGDKLLVAFGEMLRVSILGSDIAGRLGGDEFAVVLSDIGTAENAELVVRRIVRETEQPVMAGDGVVQVRGSIGIALSQPGELGLDELVAHADAAMYQAKAESKHTGTCAWSHYARADDVDAVQPVRRVSKVARIGQE